MKKIRILIASALLVITSTATATQTNNIAPPSNSDASWYYKIGGGQPISATPHTSKKAYGTEFSLTGGVGWGVNASCGDFSYNLSVANFINNLKEQAENTVTNIMGAASGMIASLPLLILQRANPGLYDLLQNGLLRAEEMFNISVKSCQEMEKDFIAGGGPFDGFVTMSRKSKWNQEVEEGGDAIAAKRSVDTDGQNQGVPWIGGDNKGGSGQSAIAVVSDVSKAGYNMVIDRSPTATSHPGGTSGGRLAEVFNNPSTMSEFAVDILGDKIIRTCRDCQKVQSKAGKGLMPILDEETDTIRTELNTLVGSSGNPTYAQLDNVSAPGIRVTPGILLALREEEPTQRNILLNKISSDIAISKVLEKALMLRRILHTGKNEPNVANNVPVIEMIDKSIDEINKEIENILFESEIRKKISTNTLTVVLARKKARDSNITGAGSATMKQPIMKDGAL
jgi:integrating conjugative element protein (TIGR03755 family)